MRICVIGAGALGGSYGGRLALAGADVTLVDVWQAHVEAIGRDGLRLDGVPGDRRVRVAAATGPQGLAPFDMAIVTVDANHSGEAAKTAAAALKPDGFALTLQNGIGNVETLVAALGRARVVGGSSMCSAAVQGPGHVTQTHQGPTTVGELDGGGSPRVDALKALLEGAGFDTRIAPDVLAVIWQKFLLNLSINPICAVTGLRLGELARLPAVDAFQDRIIAEALAVVAAKGLNLPDPDIRGTIKRHTWSKYSRPSMLQHVDMGRRTEIDALNGALVREAQALGVAVPFNEALTALVKGREFARMRAVNEPDVDYDALESAAGPWPG
ncbi:MAG: ketopantoate reductase family protein [Alphaproteobacteria bacterium]